MRWAVLLLASLTPAVSGCVAAALPLAAGAAVVKMRTGNEPSEREALATGQASAARDLQITRVALTELPPPDAAPPGVNPAVAEFRDYTLAQLALGPETKRPSALLTRAADLKTDRASCVPATNAVFVDLDPGRGTFDPLAPGGPDPALAMALGELRTGGATIVWFTRLSGSFEEATRAALAVSGFDPTGSDLLVMLRDLSERKQSRRHELAKQVCPLAMIGDERADFDELYLYLKQPEAAFALDTMIGKGWFLASPFAEVGETARGAPAIMETSN